MRGVGKNLEITLLEYSIQHGDWKAACILLAHGAHPRHNCARGIQSICISVETGLEEIVYLRSFEGAEQIRGWDGLLALVTYRQPNRAQVVLALISLAEFCHDERNTIEIGHVEGDLSRLSPEHRIKNRVRLIWTETEALHTVLTGDCVDKIRGMAIRQAVWDFLTINVVDELASITQRQSAWSL